MMSEPLAKHIEHALEVLCNDGCNAVRNYIVALESGASLPALKGFSAADKQQVLLELKQIMSIYDNC